SPASGSAHRDLERATRAEARDLRGWNLDRVAVARGTHCAGGAAGDPEGAAAADGHATALAERFEDGAAGSGHGFLGGRPAGARLLGHDRHQVGLRHASSLRARGGCCQWPPRRDATCRLYNPRRDTSQPSSLAPALLACSVRLRGDSAMKLVGVRVLLIEDVSDIRDVVVILLRSEGADVVATDSGQEGSELPKKQRFDVVLSALGLPDIAGDVLVRQLRAVTPFATRVVVITGYGEPYISRARQAGADAVFTKPVEWTHILEY